MRERLNSIPRPIIVIGLLLVVWQVWRMFMPLPPATYIGWVYPKPSPATSSSDGEVISSDDSATVVDGIYRVPWGVVAVYHTEQGYGWTVMRKGWFWWRDTVSAGVSLEPVQPDDDVAYGVEIPYGHVSADGNDPTNGLRWGQLIVGQRINPAVQGVRVRFDDGFVQEARMSGDRFALFSTEHGAACELTTIGTDGKDIHTERIDSFDTREDLQDLIAFGHEPANIDCAGMW